MTLGAIFSTIGYIQLSTLIFGVDNPRTLYTLSTLFILGAGPTYAGADYFICGRLFSFVPSVAPMSPIRAVRTFIAFDLLAEVCVWIGAGLLTGANMDTSTRYKIGLNLVRVAMIIQAVLFASFVVVLACFHVRVSAVQAKWRVNQDRTQRKFMTVLYCLYASSLLIIVRSAYHISGMILNVTIIYPCEFSQANITLLLETFVPKDHSIRTTETPFLICEGLVMLLNTGTFNIFHPGQILPIDSRVFVGSDGIERVSDAVEGALNDPRPLSQKILDPLDIKGLFSKEKKTAYDPLDGIEINHSPSHRRVSN